MRIGFVINSIATEKPEYTTVRLALAAARKGHDTWMMGVDDFSHRADGTVAAHARSAANSHHASEEAFLESIQDAEHGSDDISINDLEVLAMRNDPAEDMSERPWAVTSGVLFAQLSVAAGTLVVNDPASLANAVNKTYFQHFPEAVSPGRSSLAIPATSAPSSRSWAPAQCSNRCRDRVERASSSSPTTSHGISIR